MRRVLNRSSHGPAGHFSHVNTDNVNRTALRPHPGLIVVLSSQPRFIVPVSPLCQGCFTEGRTPPSSVGRRGRGRGRRASLGGVPASSLTPPRRPCPSSGRLHSPLLRDEHIITASGRRGRRPPPSGQTGGERGAAQPNVARRDELRRPQGKQAARSGERGAVRRAVAPSGRTGGVKRRDELRPVGARPRTGREHCPHEMHRTITLRLSSRRDRPHYRLSMEMSWVTS